MVSATVNAGRGGFPGRDGRHIWCRRYSAFACTADDGSTAPDGMEQRRRRYLYGAGSDVSGLCLLWLRACAHSGQYGNHDHSAGAGYSRAAGRCARW